ILKAQNDLDGAIAEYRGALAIAERLTAKVPSDEYLFQNYAGLHENLGMMLALKKDDAGALAEMKLAQALIEGRAAKEPANQTWQEGRAEMHDQIGGIYAHTDRAKARSELEMAIEIQQKLV